MKQFHVEGLVAVPEKRSRRKAEVQPFARSYWANSPEEALQLARADVPGGEWLEGPRLAKQSEELRMRKSGAPELFSIPKTQKTTHRRPKK